VDVATQAAVTDHVTNGRYIFGFGSGFPNAFFSEECGLSFEHRHERPLDNVAHARSAGCDCPPALATP